MLTKLCRRIFQTGVLLAAMTTPPATAGCVRKPIIAQPDRPDDRTIVCEKRPTISHEKLIEPTISVVTRIDGPVPPDDKLITIKTMVTELNNLIPRHPVTTVEISNDPCGPGFFFDVNILISFSALEGAVHEMGHAIYFELIEKANINIIWEKLYDISLGFRKYELFIDEYYWDASIVQKCKKEFADWNKGHPWDDPNELFASSFMIYRLHPDQFLAKILDPATSEENRIFGMLIFIFMRDWVFQGKVFSNTDPFKVKTLCHLFDDNVLLEKLEKLKLMRTYSLSLLYKDYLECNDCYWTVRHILLERIITKTKDKSLLIQVINQGMADESAHVRSFAYYALGCIIEDSTFCIKFELPQSEIDQLRKEGKTFIGPLLKALKFELSKDYKGDTYIEQNVKRVLWVLGDIGDMSVIADLQKLKHFPGDIGLSAWYAIRKIRYPEK